MDHYRRESQQFMNQLNSQAGLPAILDDEWIKIARMARESNKGSHFVSENPRLERDPNLQMIARRYIEASRHRGYEIAKHGGPQYDPNNFYTMNRRYALLVGYLEWWHPLSDAYTWRDVSDKYLAGETRCGIGVSNDCTTDNRQGLFQPATEVIRIPYGEIDVVSKICSVCLAWFDDPNHEHLPYLTDGKPSEEDYSERPYVRYPLDDVDGIGDLDDDDPWS